LGGGGGGTTLGFEGRAYVRRSCAGKEGATFYTRGKDLKLEKSARIAKAPFWREKCAFNKKKPLEKRPGDSQSYPEGEEMRILTVRGN